MNTKTSESKQQLKRVGGIDPAALAAASLASAISTIAQPGPYTLVSLMVGATILILVLAYDVEPKRSSFQSLAYSAVVSLTAVLAIGYPLELFYSTLSGNQSESAVPQVASFILWLIFSLFFYWRDKPARPL
jgi:hypothetical protein